MQCNQGIFIYLEPKWPLFWLEFWPNDQITGLCRRWNFQPSFFLTLTYNSRDSWPSEGESKPPSGPRKVRTLTNGRKSTGLAWGYDPTYKGVRNHPSFFRLFGPTSRPTTGYSADAPKLLPPTSDRSDLGYWASYTYHIPLWKPISLGKNTTPSVPHPTVKKNAPKDFWLIFRIFFPKKDIPPTFGVCVFNERLEPKDESYSMYKSMLEVMVAWVWEPQAGERERIHGTRGAWCGVDGWRHTDISLKSHKLYIFSPKILWNPEKSPKKLRKKTRNSWGVFLHLYRKVNLLAGLRLPKVCTVFRLQNVVVLCQTPQEIPPGEKQETCFCWRKVDLFPKKGGDSERKDLREW